MNATIFVGQALACLLMSERGACGAYVVVRSMV